MKRGAKNKRTLQKRSRKLTVPIKRILVPIDFSEYSLGALDYARRFAKTFGAELLLLHVVEPTVYPADFGFGQIGIPNLEEELRKHSSEELERLRKKTSDVPTRCSVRTGKPFWEIIESAREEKADLIIIASHGHTGVEHILFGSTAEKVVRKAHCPVLTVRAAKQNFGSQ